MIVLVCGGRDFSDYHRVKWALDELNPTLIVHGEARGADSLADRYALLNGIPQIKFPANWNGEGKSAGYRRNARMLEFVTPDTVVAFPGGRGTEMMVRLSREAGVHITEV